MYYVLYVDDEYDLLDLGKLFLERTPEFRVEIASSARDALALLANRSFDAIVSDYQMSESRFSDSRRDCSACLRATACRILWESSANCALTSPPFWR